jgi:hypothetical protein
MLGSFEVPSFGRSEWGTAYLLPELIRRSTGAFLDVTYCEFSRSVRSILSLMKVIFASVLAYQGKIRPAYDGEKSDPNWSQNEQKYA